MAATPCTAIIYKFLYRIIYIHIYTHIYIDIIIIDVGNPIYI